MAEKPERKALKGYRQTRLVSERPLRRPGCHRAIAYVVAGQDAVQELQGADDDQEGHEGAR